jgi:hypothetical protein
MPGPADPGAGLANTERQSRATRRSHPARDWIGDPYRDRALWYFFACLIVTVVLLVVADSVDRPDSRDQEQTEGSLARGFVEHVNRGGGYRFIYPQTWGLRDKGRTARVTSPDGSIDLSFRPRPDGERGLTPGSIRRLHPELTHERVIGSRWELIGGSLSLLVGGTATDASGSRVRFLDISVGAEPQNYAITIVVPFTSDPGKVLARIEAIVSSFETLRKR